MNLLRSLKFTLDRKSLQQIYFTFIRPVLEYADLVWDNCTEQQSELLEKIQREAGRIVTGTTKFVGIEELDAELGWLKLSERRNLHKLYQFFKLENDLSPMYLTNLIPPRVGERTNYPLRNSDHYVTMRTNSRSYSSSFLPSTIIAWNNLPVTIKSATTIASFKHMLAQNNTRIPEYYFEGERMLQILYTRLRTECSSLNEQLFRRNLVPSPNCLCGEIEDNRHFLLICPRYNIFRQDMLNLIQSTIPQNVPINTALLLFGDQATLSMQENSFVFAEVQKYIKLTKRFAS